jgi:hypothetical protein
MEEILVRAWDNLTGRIGGPMTFRFVVQPLVAIFLGVRDGLRLGKSGRALFSWREHHAPGSTRVLIQGIWRSIRILVLVALTLDFIYQILFEHWLYPGEAALVGIAITIAPYLLACSTVSAFTSWRVATRSHKQLSSIR